MICRHEIKKQIVGLYPQQSSKKTGELTESPYKECAKCGVWIGNRSDPHHYTYEYYNAPVHNNFRNGIPLRSINYERRKKIWKKLGFDVENDKGDDALELGFGTGFLLYGLYLDGWDVVGVDLSSWACAWVKETYGDIIPVFNANFENIDKSILTNRTLNGKFDFIYSCHFLEHCENPMKVIEDCVEMLNSGGHLFAEVPDKLHTLAMPHVHNWAFDEKCLRLWFKQAGLKKIKTMTSIPFNAPITMPGKYIYIMGVKK